MGHRSTLPVLAFVLAALAAPVQAQTTPTGIITDRAKNCSEGNSVDGCIFRDNFEAGDVCYWSSGVGTPACV